MVTAPTIRPPWRRWWRRSAPVLTTLSSLRARAASASRAAWRGISSLAGRIAGFLTRLLYGVRYTDMCAYRAIRRDTLLALGMRELTYGWNLEMQMRVARAGLRVLEVPVAYRRRIGGQSKVAGTLRGSIKAGLKIMSTFARVAMEPKRGLRLDRDFAQKAVNAAAQAVSGLLDRLRCLEHRIGG